MPQQEVHAAVQVVPKQLHAPQGELQVLLDFIHSAGEQQFLTVAAAEQAQSEVMLRQEELLSSQNKRQRGQVNLRRDWLVQFACCIAACDGHGTAGRHATSQCSAGDIALCWRHL